MTLMAISGTMMIGLRIKKKVYDKPMIVYELHLGSWRRKYGMFFKFNEIVEQLIKHLREQNFTRRINACL